MYTTYSNGHLISHVPFHKKKRFWYISYRTIKGDQYEYINPRDYWNEETGEFDFPPPVYEGMTLVGGVLIQNIWEYTPDDPPMCPDMFEEQDISFAPPSVPPWEELDDEEIL